MLAQGSSLKVQKSCISSLYPKHVAFRYKIAKKMKNIRERLDEIAEERSKFHLTETVSEKRRGVLNWRQTTSIISQPQVYGRDEDKDKIIDFLVGDASGFGDLSVYPIVGLVDSEKQHLPNLSSIMSGEATEEYGQRLREVSDKLIKWLSLGLGLQEQQLKVAMGGEDTILLMKINYYPPCPRPDLALGVVAHTDMSALTVLVPNEVQGLQVFRDGHWYDVKYIPNALIIHIGDQIEILSNGKFKAVFHRTTVNKDSTRMSWPVFLEPPPEHEIGPIPELVNGKSPSKYKYKKYKDYAYCKLNKLPQ
ncbi:Iron ascorbate-dependent oxidoreductase [Orobanche gracilis]